MEDKTINQKSFPEGISSQLGEITYNQKTRRKHKAVRKYRLTSLAAQRKD
jgi:hypothetical protein